MDLPLSVCSCVLLPAVWDSAPLWAAHFCGFLKTGMGSYVRFNPGAWMVLEFLVVARLL